MNIFQKVKSENGHDTGSNLTLSEALGKYMPSLNCSQAATVSPRELRAAR